MGKTHKVLWLAIGLVGGITAGWLVFGPAKPATAGNDRHEDFIMATGPISGGQTGPDLDGVWLLDYRSGKLLGTVVNRQTGRVTGWAEVDLVREFGIAPRQDVHFLMTTGVIAQGMAALYVAETTTGKFGIYTMAIAMTGRGVPPGIYIQRHDLVHFRGPKPAGQ